MGARSDCGTSSTSRKGQLRLGAVVSALALFAGCSSGSKVTSTATATTLASSAATAVSITPTTVSTAAATTVAATVVATTKPVATAAATTVATTKASAATAPGTTAGTVSSGSGTPSSDTTPPWLRNAVEFRGQNGKLVTFVCPPGGEPATVWGTETYTDDSSVCTAGVQVGLITMAAGGSVEIKIGPDAGSYTGMVGNGITSQDYGAWQGSFTFTKAPPGTGKFDVAPQSWSLNATGSRGQNGKRIKVDCSPNGDLGSVYGTGTYTDDSSICTAAVHAGLITQAAGGNVVIEISAGLASYTSSTANGVTSSAYGSWDGSFTFPKDQTAG